MTPPRHLTVRCSLGALALSALLMGCIPRYTAIGSSPDADEGPTVEVRDYGAEPTVAIVAWTTDETAYGLRSTLRRDGFLLRGKHRLYISAYAVVERSFRKAEGPTQPLELFGYGRDIDNCRAGNAVCSPYLTFGAQIPDELLRANRDSMPVTFYATSGREITITLRRNLIDAYLGAVDSVTTALQAKSQVASSRVRAR